MADRAAIERAIRSVYAARIRGDLDEVMRHFTDNASYSLAGAATANPVPAAATGAAAVREVLRRLIEGFEFLDTEMTDLIVDPTHGRAAVHTRVHVRVPATGREARTELFDLVELEGDKIKSIRQFADTALAAHLLGR